MEPVPYGLEIVKMADKLLSRSPVKILWCLVSSFLILISVTAVMYCFGPLAKLAPGISREGLLSVHPGMGEAEVVALIGKPLRRDAGTLIYGEPNIFDGGLEIYLNMENGQVTNVVVEHHDLGVYWQRKNEEPVFKKPKLLDRLPRR